MNFDEQLATVLKQVCQLKLVHEEGMPAIARNLRGSDCVWRAAQWRRRRWSPEAQQACWNAARRETTV